MKFKNLEKIIKHFQTWVESLNFIIINFYLERILLIQHSQQEKIFLILQKSFQGIKYMKIKKKKVCKFQIKHVRQKEIEQDRTMKLLEDLQEKLEIMNHKKRKFEKFEEQTQMIDDIKKLIFERKLKNLEKKQKEIEKKAQDNQNLLDTKIIQKQQIENDVQNLKLKISKLTEIEDQEVDIQEIFENTAFCKENIDKQNFKINNGKKNFKKNLQQEQINEKRIAEINDLMIDLCESQNKLVLQRQQIESKLNFQSFKSMSKNQQKEIIKQNQQHIKNIKKEIKKLQEQNQEVQKEIDYNQKIKKEQENHQKLQCEKISNQYKDLTANKDKLDALIKKQVELKQQYKKKQNSKQILEQAISQKTKQLIKIKGSNNLSVLIFILEEYKKNKPKGKVDFLINCINFPKSMNVPIEALYYKDLFSIIVEKVEDAQILIKLNEKHKGGKIKILPLEWIKEKKNQNISMIQNNSFSKEDIVKIKDYITIKQNNPFNKKIMNKLLEQIFGNSIYVKNKDSALKIAKEENINTVTQDGEIFYAGAYIGKIGRFQIENSKLTLFQDIIELRQKIQSDQDESLNKEKLDLEKQIKIIQEDILSIQSQIKLIESSYNQIKISIKNKQNQLITLTKTLFNNKSLIEVKDEMIKNLNDYDKQDTQTSNKNSVNYKKFQKKIQEIDNKILQNHKEQEELRKESESLLDYREKEIQKLSQNLKQTKDSDIFTKSIKRDSNNNDLEKNNNFQKQLQSLEDDKEKNLIQIEKLKKIQSQFQGKLQGLMLQILDLTNQIQSLCISEDNQFEEERTKELIDKLKKLIKKTKNTFSEKDQVAFHRLREINKKEKDFNDKLKSIDDNKKTLIECFGILKRLH